MGSDGQQQFFYRHGQVCSALRAAQLVDDDTGTELMEDCARWKRRKSVVEADGGTGRVTANCTEKKMKKVPSPLVEDNWRVNRIAGERDANR